MVAIFVAMRRYFLIVLEPNMSALLGNIESLKRVLSASVLAVFDARAPNPLAGVLDIFMNSPQPAG